MAVAAKVRGSAVVGMAGAAAKKATSLATDFEFIISVPGADEGE